MKACEAAAAGGPSRPETGVVRVKVERPGLERSERLMLWLLLVAIVCVVLAVLSPLYVGFGAHQGMGSVFFPGLFALGTRTRWVIAGEAGREGGE